MRSKSRFFWLPLIFLASFLLGACADPQSQNQPVSQLVATVVPTVAKAPEIEGEISLDRNFYLVIDDSGSMGDKQYAGSFPSRMEAAKWAVKEFVAKAVPDDVNLGLYTLNRRELVPPGKDKNRIITEISKIGISGGTPLNSAIIDAVNALVKQRNKQLGYGEFYIVVATDGQATDDDERVRRGAGYALKNGIPIITIGFGIGKEHALSSQSLSFREALNPDELLEALKETQAESVYFDSTVGK